MKKSNSYERLKLDELQALFVMREEGVSFQKIGDLLKRSKSTIWNAANNYKHRFPGVWRKMTALEKAKHVFDEMVKNRERHGNHGYMKDSEARSFVIEKLRDDRSPEEIEVLMNRELPRKAVCFKTIYNFTKYERKDLQQYLFERGKPRRQRVSDRRGRFRQGAPAKRSIHERTAEINERLEPGHLEGDIIVSKKGGSGGVLVVVDRVARITWIRKTPNLQAETVLAIFRALIHQLPPRLRKSITFDNGSEFAISDFSSLEKCYDGFLIYYCDAYASWQKGTVENTNKRIRRYFPKGTDFAAISKEEIYHVEQRVNRKLMKCLGWRTPDELWTWYQRPESLLPIAA